MLDAAEGKSPGKRGREGAEAGLPPIGMPVATIGAQAPTVPTAGGPIAPIVGGIQRPWMLTGESLRARTLVEDTGVVLWEGGTKTTTEIKREILDLLDQMDSLVAAVDLKRAERPDEAMWWPSLQVVKAWEEEDPFFGMAMDRWRHARQERILEATIWDLNAGKDLSKAQLELLKLRLKFTSTTLPRMVNKGMREKVDVETTNTHHHFFESLSDEALNEKLRALRQNPRVLEFLAAGLDGQAKVIEGQVLPPTLSPGLEPILIQDPGKLGKELLGDDALGAQP